MSEPYQVPFYYDVASEQWMAPVFSPFHDHEGREYLFTIMAPIALTQVPAWVRDQLPDKLALLERVAADLQG